MLNSISEPVHVSAMITLSKKLKQGTPVKKDEEPKRISVRDKLLVKGKV